MRALDGLEILLPDAPPAIWQRAQRVTTFLRLLSSDGRSTAQQVEHLELDRARRELDRETAAQIQRATLQLLDAQAFHALGPDTFLGVGDTEEKTAESWRVLAELREECEGVAEVPEPSESRLTLLERLCAALERCAPPPGILEVWRARIARIESGPSAGEGAFRRWFETLEKDAPADPRLRRWALAGWIECCLERGAVRVAAVELEARATLVVGDTRLKRLASWVRVLLGDAAAARALSAGLANYPGRLPLSLSELREARSDWLALLPGRCTPVSGVRDFARPEKLAGRGDLGASVLVLLRSNRDGSSGPLTVDVAPALKPRVAPWLEERASACQRMGAIEHEVVLAARGFVHHRAPEARLTDALDPDALARAVEPVIDAHGEVAGWLWLEFEHHLVPSAARRAALAASRAIEVLSAPTRAPRQLDPPASASAARVDALASVGPRGRVFDSLIEHLGIRTRERSWWGISTERGARELVARGGVQPVLGETLATSQLLIDRAERARGAVILDDPGPGQRLHPSSSSALVLPIPWQERIVGFLVIESTRRRDFHQCALERMSEQARACAGALRSAQFSVWHERVFGQETWMPLADHPLESSAEQGLVLTRSRSPALISGPCSTGKRIWSRWVHFESQADGAPLVSVTFTGELERDRMRGGAARRSGRARARASPWARARGGSIVLERLDRLEPRLQQHLALRIEREQEHVRVLATVRCDTADAATCLTEELRSRFCGPRLVLGSLAERRSELAQLMPIFIARIARRESVIPPRLEDDALACLWRSNWEGGLRDLEGFLTSLVLWARGSSLDQSAVELAARRERLSLVARMPSRPAEPSLLLAALMTTRHKCGSWNKTRASLYLGWDPDTLAARLSDFGIEEHAPGSSAIGGTATAT